ncbi:hypothetical protein ACUY3K_02520 [Corynebacterium uberis]|uniref:CsbD family protein n=1 Tax=Corynebacterium TaxID=1716 RepID=UPI001D09DB3C|nr:MULTISPECIES: CsbD family protein [Corynebacterium]MCZ9309896.1 CsbD family protein [Corynebacterium sp. c6VSa_13]UDL73182.1 CsbD family protein [Corynebacterium uberis]UDL75941.1 CsbD family protein [Corynebacterium uberis]UDL78153.1 CsbD family protein [Corynebacterium uberis]UDL80436.1 CsbD family protein [Corynebacterium uberis]
MGLLDDAKDKVNEAKDALAGTDADEVKDKAQEVAGQAKDKAEDAVNDVKDKLN